MPIKIVNGVIGTISLGWTTLAAAVYSEWPPYIAGAALGTLAFLWSIKGAAEDKRYKELAKRLGESEADITAGRNDRAQMAEFYSTQIDEIKAKYRNQIDETETKYRNQIAELEQAKLKILLELQEAHTRAKQEIAVDASVARAMVALDAATAKTALLADPVK